MGNIIDYTSSNDNNKFLLKNIIMDLFHEEEYEALDYIMYQLSICYYDKPNENTYLILQGNGSNGKSFLINLIKYSFYNKNIKMPISNLLNGGNLINDWKFNIIHYSKPIKDIILNYNNLIDNTKNINKSFHIITTNHNISIDNNIVQKNVLFYKMKHNFVENPINKNEKKEIKNIFFTLSNDIDIEKQFKFLLQQYYIKLKEDYNGDINMVPNSIINNETNIWKSNL